VLLVVNVPVIRKPSDMVTFAVATTVPAGLLSAVVTFAVEKEIAIGLARLVLRLSTRSA
jgi:hypothetical protein